MKKGYKKYSWNNSFRILFVFTVIPLYYITGPHAAHNFLRQWRDFSFIQNRSVSAGL